MKTWKNKNFTKRQSDCTNIVFCQSEGFPMIGEWEECEAHEIELMNCSQLYLQANIRYFGYL